MGWKEEFIRHRQEAVSSHLCDEAGGGPPASGGNLDRAASEAVASTQELYHDGETWCDMRPTHNPTPERLYRAHRLRTDAWRRYDQAIETWLAGGPDRRAEIRIEAEQADQWVWDVYDLLYPVSIDITVEIGS